MLQGKEMKSVRDKYREYNVLDPIGFLHDYVKHYRSLKKITY